MSNREPINVYKVVLIGDSGVGKSSIGYWLLKGKRCIDNTPTVGAAFLIKDLKVPSRNFSGGESETTIKLNIWDTAGQERFYSITRMYYRNTNGCVCVFDVTNRKSFDNLSYWLKDYRDNNTEANGIILIVGNKCDLPVNKWAIDIKELEDFTYKNDCHYYLTNSVDGKNINEVFIALGKEMYAKKLPMYTQQNTVERKDQGIITDLSLKTKNMFNYEKCKCGN